MLTKSFYRKGSERFLVIDGDHFNQTNAQIFILELILGKIIKGQNEMLISSYIKSYNIINFYTVVPVSKRPVMNLIGFISFKSRAKKQAFVSDHAT